MKSTLHPGVVARLVALLLLTAATPALAANAATPPLDYEVRHNIEYATRGGESLVGDFYAPRSPGRYPALVAVHGGDWKFADAGLYRHWGPYLAEHGYVLFAIDYRLLKGNENRYPAGVNDVRAAVQFLRDRGETMKVDPDRIGLMGDSAGAQLASLVALAGDQPAFVTVDRNDVHARTSTRVKVCIAIYGVYDMAAQWEYDRQHNPDDNITQGVLGTTPGAGAALYAQASPLTYATRDNNRTAFLLAWGTKDDRVDPATQSESFSRALKQAGFTVDTLAIPEAPHYWASEPIAPGHYPYVLAPRLLQFLKERL